MSTVPTDIVPVCKKCGEPFVDSDAIVIYSSTEIYHSRCGPGETMAFDARRGGDPDVAVIDLQNSKAN